ncbi:MAG TPA: hypothetical protein VNT53_07465 [Pseudolysinimonas sp.]|nr:hypothetical protein [Pseudolysinimonas sp.]
MDARSEFPGNSWWQRLNRALFPYFGPAQVGPFEDAPEHPVERALCPDCGAPMDEHIVERPGGHEESRLFCPVETHAPQERHAA